MRTITNHNWACLALSPSTATGNSTEKEFTTVNRQKGTTSPCTSRFPLIRDNQSLRPMWPYHQQTANQQPEAQRVCLSHEVCNGVNVLRHASRTDSVKAPSGVRRKQVRMTTRFQNLAPIRQEPRADAGPRSLSLKINENQ